VRAAKGRGRSPEQVKNRLRLAGILAAAKNEELFTTRTLGRALDPVAKYPERVVQRLINLVDPPPKLDATEEPYYKHPRERKHPVTTRFMSPEEREADLPAGHFGSDEARRKAGRLAREAAKRQDRYEEQSQRRRVAAERRTAQRVRRGNQGRGGTRRG